VENFGVILIGASAAGKSVAAAALQTANIVHLERTFTTRARRPSENSNDGCDHIFITEEIFTKYESIGRFIATATLYGFRYGVPPPEITPPTIPLYVLKPSLVEPVRIRLPNFQTYQLEASEATVRRRMQARGQNQADITERLRLHALETAMGRRLADHIISNEGPLERTVGLLKQQIRVDQAARAQMLQ
jgi:guanylate kinase